MMAQGGKRPIRLRLGKGLRASVLLAVVALAGCASSPASYYYSLQAGAAPHAPVSGETDAGARQSQVTAQKAPVAPAQYAISLQGVKVPQQVDRSQIVVTDPASSQLHILDSYLWAAPLSDEIRRAVSAQLQQRLGVFDVSLSQLPDDLAAWKIAVTVQSFESVYDSYVALDLDWVISPVNQSKASTRICGARARFPVGAGVGALVQGHRQAVAGISQVMAMQVSGVMSFTVPAGIYAKGCTVS